MAKDFPIAVLISGRGSNLEALLRQAQTYRVAAILSDRSDAPGLAYGAQFGVPTHSFNRSKYPSVHAQKHALFSSLRSIAPELIALAGYMQIVPAEFCKEWHGKLINIHPSLLPDLPGLHTHARAIAEGRTTHGCTVGFVDSGVDTGPIIAQAECPVHGDDTPETLAERVLEQEHRLYPWVVNQIADDQISLRKERVLFSHSAIQSAQEFGFRLSESPIPHEEG